MVGRDSTWVWLLLPIASALWIYLGARLGAVAFRGGALRSKIVGGAVLVLAFTVVAIRLLSLASLIAAPALFATLVAACVAVTLYRRDATLGISQSTVRSLFSRETLPFAFVCVGALLVCCASAYLLPIWQWDALGYHLPYVNFVLQSRSLAGVPDDMPYISTYPHVVEFFFIAVRAFLPDDRLIDCAQIPFALLGATATAAIARELGARRDHAIAAGCAWLTMPALFLELPTNYIDVGTAALLLSAANFVIAPPTRANLVLASIAIGLFLGSKPNAPIGTSVLFAAVAVRAWRAGVRRELVALAACVLAFGADSYVANFVRHGNPIWPVDARFGPIHLVGTTAMSSLLDSGAAAPRITGFGPFRILRAWFTLNAPPVFDMRFGGLGVVFVAAFPFAALALVRTRALALYASVAAALASPDPAVARYIFAFPALVLALSATFLDRVGARVRAAILGCAAAGAAVGLVLAYPGLAGEGPPLVSYFDMSAAQRLRSVGADGRPEAFIDAHSRVKPGEWIAFDESLDLPYLAWPSDLSHGAIWLGDLDLDLAAAEPMAGAARLDRILEDPSVRMLIVGDLSRAAGAAPKHFNFLFHCKSSPCSVFIRR